MSHVRQLIRLDWISLLSFSVLFPLGKFPLYPIYFLASTICVDNVLASIELRFKDIGKDARFLRYQRFYLKIEFWSCLCDLKDIGLTVQIFAAISIKSREQKTKKAENGEDWRAFDQLKCVTSSHVPLFTHGSKWICGEVNENHRMWNLKLTLRIFVFKIVLRTVKNQQKKRRLFWENIINLFLLLYLRALWWTNSYCRAFIFSQLLSKWTWRISFTNLKVFDLYISMSAWRT